MRTIFLAIVAATVSCVPPAVAQSTDHASHHVAQSPAAGVLVDGEVRKVDKAAGKLTLRHAPIPNLDMPEMTMVFRVKDPAMLDKVNAGDKVRFAADKIGGQYTVVAIELAK